MKCGLFRCAAFPCSGAASLPAGAHCCAAAFSFAIAGNKQTHLIKTNKKKKQKKTRHPEVIRLSVLLKHNGSEIVVSQGETGYQAVCVSVCLCRKTITVISLAPYSTQAVLSYYDYHYCIFFSRRLTSIVSELP